MTDRDDYYDLTRARRRYAQAPTLRDAQWIVDILDAHPHWPHRSGDPNHHTVLAWPLA